MTERDDRQLESLMRDVHWDFDRDMSYGEYLQLDKVLAAQRPLSGQHDEMLFIIIHQASELWLKLCLHELLATRDQVRDDELEPAFKMLSRVARTQAQMIQSWDVLATMTPADYTRFRDALGHSSGFQSWQYRHLEFLLGAKDARMIEVHAANPQAYAQLAQALEEPSLYDECLRLLERRGFDIPEERLERDFSGPYEPHPLVEEAWLEVYRESDRHW
ncbi:MAG: tryptophan 2,3-dioxygenase, partial [Proteobacteria bacterium]|nr:tryptophan 2,3-dioxygenase [Pseudomonadota bacterium]